MAVTRFGITGLWEAGSVVSGAHTDSRGNALCFNDSGTLLACSANDGVVKVLRDTGDVVRSRSRHRSHAPKGYPLPHHHRVFPDARGSCEGHVNTPSDLDTQ